MFELSKVQIKSLLDPFVIYSLYILVWFLIHLDPFHVHLDPFHVYLDPFHVYLDPFRVYKLMSILIGLNIDK